MAGCTIYINITHIVLCCSTLMDTKDTYCTKGWLCLRCQPSCLKQTLTTPTSTSSLPFVERVKGLLSSAGSQASNLTAPSSTALSSNSPHRWYDRPHYHNAVAFAVSIIHACQCISPKRGFHTSGLPAMCNLLFVGPFPPAAIAKRRSTTTQASHPNQTLFSPHHACIGRRFPVIHCTAFTLRSPGT